jgi:hypothetical protein
MEKYIKIFIFIIIVVLIYYFFNKQKEHIVSRVNAEGNTSSIAKGVTNIGKQIFDLHTDLNTYFENLNKRLDRLPTK